MKRKLQSTFALLYLLVLSGCASDLTETLNAGDSKSQIPARDLAAIEALGFKTDNITVFEDSYWVEGDIVIPKEQLQEMEEGSQTRQKYYGDTRRISQNWLSNKNNTITIAVSYDSGDNMSYTPAMKRYYNALTDAIADFNSISNFKIKLEKRERNQPYDILVTIHRNFSEDYMCAASIPLNGEPGSRIYVNGWPDILPLNWANIPVNKIKGSLIHAIGHCLGLAHTDAAGSSAFDEDRYGQQQLNGTPTADYASVMNVKNHYYSRIYTYQLSADDKAALSFLYPKVIVPTLNLQISSPATGYTNEEITFQVRDGNTLLSAADYDFQWIAPGGTITGSSLSNQLKVKYGSAGNKTVSVNVTHKLSDYKYNTVSTSISIQEKQYYFDFTGPTSGKVYAKATFVVTCSDPVIYSIDWGITGGNYSISSSVISSDKKTATLQVYFNDIDTVYSIEPKVRVNSSDGKLHILAPISYITPPPPPTPIFRIISTDVAKLGNPMNCTLTGPSDQMNDIERFYWFSYNGQIISGQNTDQVTVIFNDIGSGFLSCKIWLKGKDEPMLVSSKVMIKSS